MPDTDRMYLLKNLDRFNRAHLTEQYADSLGLPVRPVVLSAELAKTEKLETFTNEFEVTVDANVTGEFSRGPYSLLPWSLEDVPPGQSRKLVLGVRFCQNHKKEKKSGSNVGSYHIEGGIPAEIVVLSSLFLRRRFILGPVIRWDGRPCMLARKDSQVDPETTEECDLDELETWFELTEGLKEECQQKFMLAARLYYISLKLIEEHADIAYINLVSAIEALCYDQTGELETEEDNSIEFPPIFREVLSKIDDPELRENFRKELIHNSGATRKFVCFIMNHIEDDFWNDPTRPEGRKIEKNEMTKYLSRVYNQRSATLHRGEPFPADIFDSPSAGSELISAHRTIGSKRWKSKEIIPHPSFFEKLVNHVLKTYLKENQNASIRLYNDPNSGPNCISGTIFPNPG